MVSFLQDISSVAYRRDSLEKIKEEIKAIYSNSQKPVNVAKQYPTLYLKARKAFGSWKKAIEACGMDYERTRNRRKWSREKIANEIKKLYSSGKSLRPSDLKKKGMTYILSAATYHFGSWAKALDFCSVKSSYGKGKETNSCGHKSA